METLYAARDAFFWWTGVWATVTLCNRAVRVLTARPKRRGEPADNARDHEQYRREFARTMAELGREFLEGFDQGHADGTPDVVETPETAEADHAETGSDEN